jgi:hypothetical protein
VARLFVGNNNIRDLLRALVLENVLGEWGRKQSFVKIRREINYRGAVGGN